MCVCAPYRGAHTHTEERRLQRTQGNRKAPSPPPSPANPQEPPNPPVIWQKVEIEKMQNEKMERTKRLERFARAAMKLVHIPSRRSLMQTNAGLAHVASEVAHQSWTVAEAMELIYQERLER